MTPIYRYFLRIDNGAQQACQPVLKQDLSLVYEVGNDAYYHRAKLSDKVTFIAADFTAITTAAFDSTFYLDIEMSVDRGLAWNAYYTGKFHITDCEIDYDNKEVSVTPDYNDRYTALLDGWEREYNLVKLCPQLVDVTLHKRPMLQFYVLGDTKVTNVLRGLSWEQDCEGETDRNALVNTYHFGYSDDIKEIYVSGSNSAADGTYTGHPVYSGNDYDFTCTLTNTNGYTIYLDNNNIGFSATLKDNNSTSLYAYVDITMGEDVRALDFQLTNINDQSIKIDAQFYSYGIFSRVLCDVETLNGSATYAIGATDIVANNRNYTRCLPYSAIVIRESRYASVTPTEWGVRDDGTYYYPMAYGIVNPVPMAQSMWRWASLWYDYGLFPSTLEVGGRAQYVMHDASPIASVISVLLAQFAPNIMHAASITYSRFLYANTNPVSGDAFKLLLTQKSNILAGNYTQAAQKATITLKMVLDALKNIYQCYWFIDTNNRLRIEHISWFKNGGSYSSDIRVVGKDYSTLQNIRNGKVWATETSKVTFDKISLPERYEFSWMDDVTGVFEGEPLVINSAYVQADKKEEVQVANITTDVDFMLLSPSECSQDGFALLACNTTSNVLNGSGACSADNAHIIAGSFAEGSQGRAATIIVTATGGGTGQIYWYNGTTIVAQSLGHPQFAADGNEHQISVTIPAAANAVGFLANGSVSVTSMQLVLTNGYNCPFVSVTYGGNTLEAQNGYLAFTDLLPKYWVDDLPATDVTINGSSVTASGTKRIKTQDITAPAGDTDPDPNNLIRTNIGDGEIKTMSINLSSRAAKYTLRYD